MAHKQRVTILNDYPEFLDLMVDFLTEEGYEVVPIPKHQAHLNRSSKVGQIL